MNVLLGGLAAGLGALASPALPTPYSCVDMPLTMRANYAQRIFSGTVVAATTTAGATPTTTYYIVPDKVWRGNKSDTLHLEAMHDYAVVLAVGTKYVLLLAGAQLTSCDGVYTGAQAAATSTQLNQLFTHRRYRRGPAKW